MKPIWTKNTALLLILFSFVTFFSSIILFYNYVVEFSWILFHLFVISFFAIGSIYFFKGTNYSSEKKFIRYLFLWSMIIKIIIVFFNYYIFKQANGFPFIIHSDPYAYNKWGEIAASNLHRGIYNPLYIFMGADLSDMGGFFYYGFIYYLFGWLGNNIIIARIFNSFFASLTVIYFYKILRLVAEQNVARSSTILFMLFPLFNLYAGTHYKESVFLFLLMIVSYESYKIFLNKHYNNWNILWLVVTLIASLFFRMLMGPVIILSFSGLIFYNRQRKATTRFKLTIIGVFILLLIPYKMFLWNPTLRFIKGANTYSERVIAQTERNKGGRFAFKDFISEPVQYAAPIFAPFPTIVTDKTLTKDFAFGLSTLISSLMVKIFLSFWSILGLYYLFKNDFKRNSYILLFFVSYYIIIGISGNGFIIRYLMPAIPFFIYFAVVGLNQYKKFTPQFLFFLFAMVIVILFFNFKKVQVFGML